MFTDYTSAANDSTSPSSVSPPAGTSELPPPGASEPPPPSATRSERPRLSEWLELVPALSFEASVSQTFVGDVTGGYRIDLHFEDGARDVDNVGGPWSTRLLSGNDWVAVTSEGVMDFDTRFTIEFNEKREGKSGVHVPISARLRGRASIRDARRKDHSRFFREGESDSTVIHAWRGGIHDAYLPLRLTVTFDVPREGFTLEETELYRVLQSFGRYLYIGCGKAYFDGNPYGSVDRIVLGVYQMIGDPRMAP